MPRCSVRAQPNVLLLDVGFVTECHPADFFPPDLKIKMCSCPEGEAGRHLQHLHLCGISSPQFQSVCKFLQVKELPNATRNGIGMNQIQKHILSALHDFYERPVYRDNVTFLSPYIWERRAGIKHIQELTYINNKCLNT